MIPVSLSGGVEPGARTGTSVGGQPVVVWRGADGQVRAWADQCPHRGMRLSFGFVRGNQLTCIYHGWSFESGPEAAGTAAVCVAIPAHPGMTPPATAQVPALAVTEALGMIWVGRGPADRALEPDPDTTAVYPVRSVTVAAPVAELRTALVAEPPPGTEVATGGELITFKGAGLRVLAGLQDRGDGTSSAHLVTTDPDASARQELCRWAALVRDHLAAAVLP